MTKNDWVPPDVNLRIGVVALSLAEAEHIYDAGAEQVIVGTGQHGILKLSDEAKGFFKDHGCKVQTVPTPDAVKAWNETEDKTIAVFHVTC